MEKNTEKAVVNDNTDQPRNLRYERKFIYNNILPEDLIETEVLVNSFCFREIFHRRTVNNIYYDDQSMSFYHQNVAGDEKRNKYRLRWYGDDFNVIENPIFEIKKKIGVIGDKISIKIEHGSFNLNNLSSQSLQKLITEQIEANKNLELPLHLGVLSPTLYNSYERRYFLSSCDLFRVTIDYNMTFYNPNELQYTSSKKQLPDIVLELKYNVNNDKEARNLTQELNTRLSKNSKYVRGINLINYTQDT